MISLNDLINGFKTGEAWYVIVAFIFFDIVEFMMIRMTKSDKFYVKMLNIGIDELAITRLFISGTFVFSAALLRAVLVNKIISTIAIIIMFSSCFFMMKNAQTFHIWKHDDDDDDDDWDDEY